jgi:hypothetical protein
MTTVQQILEQAKTLSRDDISSLVYELMPIAEMFPFMMIDAPLEYEERDEEELNIDYATYLAAVKNVHDWYDICDDYMALQETIYNSAKSKE